MSEETTTEVTEEIPAPPEPPQHPVEDPKEGSEGEQPEGVSEEASGDSEAAQEPIVTNGPNGQTVTLPDGRVVTTRAHPYPVSNSEQQSYEKTHHGDQLRYPYVPGDANYSPYSDPTVPNSHLAQRVEAEISGYGERVKQDPNAAVSPMWNALKGVADGTLENAIKTGVASGNVEL